ncbi:hypothetical protein COR50_01635 [Chitinophaga caeni]|uniref:Uncharacterized protein n=1 Tax=Chitinophaga caeni TaxID=2029983 RepID=A0A291QPV8_9BACT|nr:hypothetical protein [Chitinophaga caeni]ATL45966.1 hypothetical protein COR50_01635 [Chitinophaga caeni]
MQKIWSIILLGAFAFHTLPGDFIHDIFANHTDTKDDEIHHIDGDYVGIPHRHCEFIQIGYSPYDVYEVEHVMTFTEVRWFYAIPSLTYHVPSLEGLSSLRAPPIV